MNINITKDQYLRLLEILRTIEMKSNLDHESDDTKFHNKIAREALVILDEACDEA